LIGTTDDSSELAKETEPIIYECTTKSDSIAEGNGESRLSLSLGLLLLLFFGIAVF